MEYTIREMKPSDWLEVSRIYKQGIDSKTSTFETDLPTWEHWNNVRIKECRFIAEYDGAIMGWIALGKISPREAYKQVAEISIYVDDKFKGMGVGKALINKVSNEAFKSGFTTLQSTIIEGNMGRFYLHKSCGFREVGYREKIAMINGVYKDTILMELRKKYNN